MALNKRAEILFSQEELEALRREATRRGVSLGELVRDAVRRTYLKPSEVRRRAAIKWIISQEVGVGPWGEAKKLVGRYVDKEP